MLNSNYDMFIYKISFSKFFTTISYGKLKGFAT